VHLIESICFDLGHCDDSVVLETYIAVLNNVDYDLAKTIAVNMGGTVPEEPARANHGKKSMPLSIPYCAAKKPTIKSRRIAILVGDGVNLLELEAMRAMLKAAGAFTFVIGTRRKIYPEGQKKGDAGFAVDHDFGVSATEALIIKQSFNAPNYNQSQRSTMFDALLIPSGKGSAEALLSNGRSIHWVREAFGHCKPIGAVGDGV
jgi:catalase